MMKKLLVLSALLLALSGLASAYEQTEAYGWNGKSEVSAELSGAPAPLYQQSVFLIGSISPSSLLSQKNETGWRLVKVEFVNERFSKEFPYTLLLTWEI